MYKVSRGANFTHKKARNRNPARKGVRPVSYSEGYPYNQLVQIKGLKKT